MQIALDPLREHPAVWGGLADKCAARGVSLASGMFGTIGEDYSTIETIRRTGGIVPDDTWEQNLANITVNARIARDLGLGLVTFHAGFMPHETTDPAFDKLLDRIAKVAEVVAGQGLALAFETGQETACTLRSFLQELGHPQVGVNFDPANMILYDKGDPIESLRVLSPWLKQCHLKDATKTSIPGTWGEEVPVGTGQVDWRSFLNVLTAAGFKGPLCIEREAGNQRVKDIRAAKVFMEGLVG